MLTRRDFLGGLGAGFAMLSPALGALADDRKRLAVVTTVWRYRSHAWHMAERFLVGYPRRGQVAPAAARGRLGLRRPDARRAT